MLKLQREKLKLEQEKAKYMDREHHLERIKNTMGMMGGTVDEKITVKTAKGEEFKFDGISEKFTRKLFEWEERKNIAPESSTIALLNSNFGSVDLKDENSKQFIVVKRFIVFLMLFFVDSKLKRSRSEGSVQDTTETQACKSMGGSDGNLSQVSLESSKTRKSNEIVIEEPGKYQINIDMHLLYLFLSSRTYLYFQSY